MADFDKDMWEDFVIEVQENLEEFEPNLLLLEQEPSDRAILNDCFRNMHSIKGAANYMGFEKMATLTHKVENILDNARSGIKTLDLKAFDLLFKSVDIIRSLLKDLEKNGKETLDISEFLDELSKVQAVEENLKEKQKKEEDANQDLIDEDEELINIFQDEIKNLINQVVDLSKEESLSKKELLSILADIERVVNYVGKEEILTRLNELKGSIEAKSSDQLSSNELSSILEKLTEIFKDEVELEGNYQDNQENEYSIKVNFDEDQELYQIFLDFFKEIGKPLASLPSNFDYNWAQQCQDAIERLKSSANYMDYMEVVKIFEEWEERLAEVSTTPEEYRPEIFSNLWKKLEIILPGLSDLFLKDTKKEDTICPGDVVEVVKAVEPTKDDQDLFTCSFDNIIDDFKQQSKGADTSEVEPYETAISEEPNRLEPSKFFEKNVQTVRVNLEKVENLLEDVAELVVLRSSMSRNTALLKELYTFCLEKRMLPTSELRRLKEILLGFSEDVSAFERVVHQLQDGVMRIRMLPVAHLFNKIPRLVRDLSKRLKKEVDIHIIGSETTLDKQVMEQLSDPLIHIIRNAVDHGIEMPEERRAHGKSPVGSIVLSATQEGNFVVITVSDDGRGIDKDALSKKALKLGLISKQDLNHLDETHIYNLIFAPGISTAEEISEISGRGVGLDVVKKKIETIGGNIVVNSKKGFGTQISLRIPLTLAIIKGLVVKVGQQAMVIPVSAISEIFRVYSTDISQVEGYEIISRRQETLPFIQLKKIFRGTGESFRHKYSFAIRVRLGELDACLGVDELVAQQEIVIKPLSDYLMDRPGFAGATILGDGSIALILDLPAVLEKAKGFIKKRQQLLEMEALGIGQDTSSLLH